MERELRITGYKVKNIEELKQIAPAAFSGEHNRSRIYSFLPTTEILENLKKLGWELTYAKQQGSSNYSRHIIRLTNPALDYMPLKNDQVRPQLILDNSHNGGSSAQLHMGLFRMVCESELVISIPNFFSGIKFRHMGLNLEELKEVLAKMAEQYKIVAKHISSMQDIILTPEQKEKFALTGAAFRDPRRYINNDGTINYKNLNESIDAKTLLDPLRGGDKPMSLWATFQNVREWLIKGGFEQKSEKGRLSRAKAINNAVRQIALNKMLWTLVEEYLNKPLEANVFEILKKSETRVWTYTTAKGEERRVRIINQLDDGFAKVQDIKANRIFAVSNAKLK